MNYLQRIVTVPDPYARYRLSQGYRIGDLLFISGQAAIADDGKLVGPGDFDAQAKQAFANLERVLRAGGSSLKNVIKVTIFLTDMSHFERIVDLRGRYFVPPYPADTIVEVRSLYSPEALIEIEAVAVADEAGATLTHTTPSGPTALDQLAIADVLYRFGAGQDLRNRQLFESAFSESATLDFTQPARRLGATIPIFEGRQAIVDQVFGNIRDLDTTHTVTNPRVTNFDGKRASVFALVEAQHLLRADHRRRLVLKNIYTGEVSRSGDAWVLDRLMIENVWWSGAPEILERSSLFAAQSRSLSRKERQGSPR